MPRIFNHLPQIWVGRLAVHTGLRADTLCLVIAKMRAMIALTLLFGWSSSATAQSAPPAKLSAREIIAEAQAIAPGGIDRLQAVEIGGIKQWIHVRGTNPANPILLLLHGGPGSPMMGKSWIFQRPWEDFFTVVEWDQRGAGKTFGAAGRRPDTAMSLDEMQNDTEQLIDLLRKTYGKKKIFLMAHSFGSIIGVRIAQQRPDALYAYIGVGQVVNAIKNEAEGYKETLAQARAVGNQSAVKALEAIAPYPGTTITPEFLAKISVERKWDVALGGMRYGRTTDPEAAFWSLSPDYSADDVTSSILGEQISSRILAAQLLKVNFDHLSVFKCPVFFFEGASDRTTPVVLAEHFFERIRAPTKKFFKIERASHDVMLDAPGTMLVDLVDYVRPLAQLNNAN